MPIKVVSFSYKNRPQRLDQSDVLEIDCRGMANPHNVHELRPLTGEDEAVQQWILTHDLVSSRLQYATRALDQGFKTIAFGCIGGRHRSVALAELLAVELRAKGHSVELEHLAL